MNPEQPNKESRITNQGKTPNSKFQNRNSKKERRPRNRQAPAADLNATPVNRSTFNGTGRVANQVVKDNRVKIIPLGGLGEVGKNMMIIEYGNDAIVVDMGFAFPNDSQPGIDYVIPNFSYLEKIKHKVRGIVITHGHEDHIGALPYVLPKVPAPIYASRFTVGMIEKKLVEFRLQTQPQFRTLDPDKHEKIQLGIFQIELVRVTHSIPDSCAVAIKTPAGMLIHTGDWRLDRNPIDGKLMDLPRLEQLGKEGVLLLMSDSTNCERMGRTSSESVVAPSLAELFRRLNGRIIVSAIASNIHRMQSVIDAAVATNRKLSFAGRSMLANVELAVKLGYLRIPKGVIVRLQDAAKLPDRQVTILCTGHQGELNSVLNRMATGDHPNIKIKPGDSIVMSSGVIPGNEVSVVQTVDGLLREGAKVYQDMHRQLDECGPLHVSGHAAREDLADMIKLVKPQFFIPVHGEFHHMVRHAELAVQNGVEPKNVYVLDNGDCLEVSPQGARKGERVPAGIVMIDGSGVGDVEGVVLRDRLMMAHEGIFVIVATVDRKSGKLLSSPDIISRGFVYMKENEELIARTRGEIRKAFDRQAGKNPDWTKFKLDLRDQVADFLYGQTKRNPMIVPVINEV